RRIDGFVTAQVHQLIGGVEQANAHTVGSAGGAQQFLVQIIEATALTRDETHVDGVVLRGTAGAVDQQLNRRGGFQFVVGEA
nr:hypothetical protein [Tanacetum cinerariifolium]